MCLTQDGLALSHVDQAERLCAAGARWIQLRMKDAPVDVWLEAAKEIVSHCRSYGALCIINDSVDIALESGADGVHLGSNDGDWLEARRRIGAERILGGTVNTREDAERAVRAGCLDYVGVGPWRFTGSKKRLAPVLGAQGVADVVGVLGGIPAWAIGGIVAEDLAEVRLAGAAGAAVGGALYRELCIEDNFRRLDEAWTNGRVAMRA
jgi:thiamine-phosphate pyrophosphorylase